MARIGAHSFRGSHLSGGAKGVTALLADLKAVAEDGGGDILNVTVGNYNWGSTATAKLLQLVPKLEVINLMTSKKVSQHHNLMDWTAAKFLKSFTYECESCGTRSDKAVSFLCRLPRRPARVSSATGCYDVDSASVRNLVRTHNLLECLSLSNIEGMGETSGRSDDNRETIIKRFRAFRESSMPVVDLHKERGMLRAIDADEEEAAVFSRVCEAFADQGLETRSPEGSGR